MTQAKGQAYGLANYGNPQVDLTEIPDYLRVAAEKQ